MIQEANFNDIRRNYILASIILILFLLYGSNITIEQLLIFKFDKNGDWSILSPYWDIFIILNIFFLYTLSRYLIYGIDEVRNNRYNHLLLKFIIKSLNSQPELYITKKLIVNRDSESIDLNEIKWIEQKGNDNKLHESIRVLHNDAAIYYSYPEQITNISIKSKAISFSDISMELSIHINELVKLRFVKIFFRREFSDFLWPLGLLFPIITIFVIKVLNYFISLY